MLGNGKKRKCIICIPLAFRWGTDPTSIMLVILYCLVRQSIRLEFIDSPFTMDIGIPVISSYFFACTFEFKGFSDARLEVYDLCLVHGTKWVFNHNSGLCISLQITFHNRDEQP